MKNLLIIGGTILGGFFVIALIIALTLFSTIPYHNYVLSKFANELLHIETPSDIEVLETQSATGVLSGNGNHCDYYASILLKSPKGKDAILSYFNSQYFGDAQVEIVDLREIKDETQRFTQLAINHDIAKKYSDDVFNLDEDKSLYIVYIFEHGMTWRIGDFRCS